jgi:hypothetical protein
MDLVPEMFDIVLFKDGLYGLVLGWKEEWDMVFCSINPFSSVTSRLRLSDIVDIVERLTNEKDGTTWMIEKELNQPLYIDKFRHGN